MSLIGAKDRSSAVWWTSVEHRSGAKSLPVIAVDVVCMRQSK